MIGVYSHRKKAKEFMSFWQVVTVFTDTCIYIYEYGMTRFPHELGIKSLGGNWASGLITQCSREPTQL